VSQPETTCFWLASELLPDFLGAALEESDRILIPLPFDLRIVAINKFDSISAAFWSANRLRSVYMSLMNRSPSVQCGLALHDINQRLPLFLGSVLDAEGKRVD